jgi:type I restriction enzyme S subunit
VSVPAGFKGTEVGVIPEDWDVEPLGALIGPLDAGVSVRSIADNVASSGHGQMVLKTSCISSGKFIPTEAKSILPADLARAKTSVKGGSILISRMNTPDLVGEVGYVPKDRPNLYLPDRLWMASSATGRRNDMRWLAAHLSHGKAGQALRDTATGTSGSMKNISKTALRRVLIPTPQPEEQSAIAEALSDVDDAIAAQEAVIAKKRALKTATMQALLTRSRRLPSFSGEWVKVQIGKLGCWVGGATPSMANARYWTNGTIPWASSSDIRSGRLFSTGNRITAEAVKNTATLEVPAGTILMVTRSGILRRFLPVAIATRNIAINQDLKALLVDSTFDPNFIYHAISVRGDDILKVCMKAGTTVESIDLDWLKQFEIDIPEDKYEQAAIATALFDCEDEIVLLESKLTKLRDLKAGMMQQLLTGKIRLV